MNNELEKLKREIEDTARDITRGINGGRIGNLIITLSNITILQCNLNKLIRLVGEQAAE